MDGTTTDGELVFHQNEAYVGIESTGLPLSAYATITIFGIWDDTGIPSLSGRGEPEKAVTSTARFFSSSHHPRPAGATFSNTHTRDYDRRLNKKYRKESAADRLEHSAEDTLNRLSDMCPVSCSDPFCKIANLSLDIWDQEYVKMMDASEMRELRETADSGCIKGMGLGPIFPSPRCTFSQRQDFVAIFGTSRNLEERILSLFTARPPFRTHFARHPLCREDPVTEETCSTERTKLSAISHSTRREQHVVIPRSYPPSAERGLFISSDGAMKTARRTSLEGRKGSSHFVPKPRMDDEAGMPQAGKSLEAGLSYNAEKTLVDHALNAASAIPHPLRDRRERDYTFRSEGEMYAMSGTSFLSSCCFVSLQPFFRAGGVHAIDVDFGLFSPLKIYAHDGIWCQSFLRHHVDLQDVELDVLLNSVAAG
ncbi:hypothetical protein ARMGADRAFT_1035342 [Armillaria gallica]|uniref:Uncharacterized protein n=1 Tax=Armillaria gallica TaxID=47427 RepID=A0A2H3D7I4_ARMGA|nr:hypothetical protein ARMGADRAFT_1035342 [Armillaria gallica]